MAYAVIRTDNMVGTNVIPNTVSIKYGGSDGETPTAIENANIVMLKKLDEHERDIWVAVTPDSTTDKTNMAIVAGVENLYDERVRNLDEYINEAGMAVRAYKPNYGIDVYSATKEAFAGSPEVDKFVDVEDSSTKAKIADEKGDRTFGKIIAKEVSGRYTYYVVQTI